MQTSNIENHTIPWHAPSRAVQSWRYFDTGSTRDLRIDFLRGFVFVLLFAVHFDYFSWFSLVAWERIGVVSSAEVFIMLAGIVTGSVYGKKLNRDGPAECTLKLLKRAWTLYKIALFVSGSVALIRLVPWIDATVLTTYADPYTGKVHALYPPLEAGFMSNLTHVLVLAAGPHQFQIVGLYVILFLCTPIVFWAIHRGHARWLVLASWACYLFNYLTPETVPGTAQIQWTVGQFEYAFPPIAWQLIFIHGILAGYYRRSILEFFMTRQGYMLLAACVIASVMLLLFSWNHPLDKLPDWARFDWIAPNHFESIYQRYFLKYKLGPGRIFNTAVWMVSSFLLLTLLWKPVNRALGWLFIPLGTQSMYVFLIHVYLLLIVANSPLPALQNAWVNTAIVAGALLLCWIMIKKKLLFRWIPH